MKRGEPFERFGSVVLGHEETDRTAWVGEKPDMDFYDGLIRMVSALAVVLGLMAVCTAIARRAMRARALGRREGPLVQVLSTGYLGPRTSISLVAVAEELFVIGATSTDLIPLGRISDPERVRRVASAKTTGTAEAQIQDGPCSVFEA